MGEIIAPVVGIGSRLLLSLFSTPNRERSPDVNPRLPDSSYGRNIPKPYNYFRYTLNWIEPVDEDTAFSIETKKKKRGGKGGGGGETKEKIVRGIFAGIACAGEVDLKKLWLQGESKVNFLSDDEETLSASNNWYDEYITWFSGTGTQLPWSELEAMYGVGNVSGYRSYAYAGFYRLPLEPFSNTFPAADVLVHSTEDYGLGGIIKDICFDAGIPEEFIDVEEIWDIGVQGFSRPQSGGTYKESIEQLMSAFFFYPVETPEGKLSFRTLQRPEITLAIPREDLAAHEEGSERPDNWRLEIGDPKEIPTKLTVTYYDPDLDFDQGSVSADPYPGKNNENEQKVDLQVVLTSEQAKTIANRLLHQLWIRRYKYFFSLPVKYLGRIIPGDVVLLPTNGGDSIPVQIQQIELGATWLLEIEGVLYDVDSLSFSTSVPNSGIPRRTGNIPDPTYTNPNNPNTIAQVYILDIPLADESEVEIGLYALSNRANTTLYMSRDVGESYEDILTFTTQSTIGTCSNILPAIPKTNLQSAGLPLTDTTNTVTVTLETGELESITQVAFDNEENLAFVGKLVNGVWEGEYISFQNANLVAPKQYQLSNLKRGLRGTEYAIDEHTTGEKFFLLKGTSGYLERLPGTTSDIGKELRFKLISAAWQNFDTAPMVAMTVQGRSLFPYAPVNISYANDAAGNALISWTPRSRGESLRTGENAENYEIEIRNGTVVRTLNANRSSVVYPSISRTTDSTTTNFDLKIYKISSLTGRGFPGETSSLTSGATINTSVGDLNSDSLKGFKVITTNYTIAPEDDGYVLLFDTTSSNITLTLNNTAAIAHRNYFQNIGTGLLNLTAPTLRATSQEITSNAFGFLIHKGLGEWLAQVPGSGSSTPELTFVGVNASRSILASDNGAILECDTSSTDIEITLLETGIDSGFQCVLRNVGSGNLTYSSSSTIQGIIAIVSQYRAVHVAYKGNNIWAAIGGIDLTDYVRQADLANYVQQSALSDYMERSLYDTDEDGIVDTAQTAQSIQGAFSAGNSKYYGTNLSGAVGFYSFPTSGDMNKSIYDTNNNGIVDSASQIAGIEGTPNLSYYGKNSQGNIGFHSLSPFVNITFKDISLDYTLQSIDNNLELVVSSGNGTLFIPNAGSSFDNFKCLLSLDGTGIITIAPAPSTSPTLIFSGGGTFNKLKRTGGTIAIRHRGNNTWKIEGATEE